MDAKQVNTVKGSLPARELGFVLPHEHLFTDLRGPDIPDYAQARPEEVVATMLPFLEEAYRAGVQSLVECSTVGVGRNVTILQQLAQATPIVSAMAIASPGIRRNTTLRLSPPPRSTTGLTSARTWR